MPTIAFEPGRVSLASHQIQIIGLDIFRAVLLDRLLLFGQKFNFERVDDCVRYLVLEREDVVKIAIVTFRPNVTVIRAID